MPERTSTRLDHKDYWDEYLPLPLKNHGLVMQRGDGDSPPGGTVKTNVPHRVERSSPDGFEFAYAGSGPSDLGLNAVEHLIQHLASEGVIAAPTFYYTEEEGDLPRGRVSKMAFQLAPEFTAAFVAPVSRAGGAVEYEVLKEWLLARIEDAPHHTR